MNYYNIQSKSYFITGGTGYVGKRLAKKLLDEGAKEVAICDIRAPEHVVDPAIKVFVGDIRDESLVEAWMSESRPDCVIHVASFGMSGREMVMPDRTWSINLEGTRNICRACTRHQAQMIYISTVNVCFDGTEIVDGDEDMDYATAHVDAYSHSKMEAEKLVRGYPELRAIVLRPYGIYGEGEERHFPRMIRYFQCGLFFFFGSPQDRSDWVHADNLVHAILLADAKLSLSRQLDGRAYFIGDGEPVNTLLMCEPLWALVSGGPAQGLRRIWTPYSVLYFFGWLTERTYFILNRCFGISFEPLLSRAEVNKVARTHFWKTDRVSSELGYAPIVSRSQGLSRMFRHFEKSLRAQGYPHRYLQQSSLFSCFSLIILLHILLAIFVLSL